MAKIVILEVRIYPRPPQVKADCVSSKVDLNTIETIQWIAGEESSLSPDPTRCLVRLIDQTLLPSSLEYLDLPTVEGVWQAIKRLSVRGAPAIGIAAGYGVCLACRENADASAAVIVEKCFQAADYLATSRPTAVNLFWALDRMRDQLEQISRELESQPPAPANAGSWVLSRLLPAAVAIHQQDRQMCHAIGRHGAQLLNDGDSVLTHCNAGGLATAEYGTALSVFFTSQDQGKKLHVYVDETRPLLQGARLTAWELQQRGVDSTLICDNMAAHVMRNKQVDAVITGADRIAANGDSANKIGTYGLAILARFHNIPFYIAAPSSTFDFAISSGDCIPIEERGAEEITHGFGRQTAPDGMPVYNPAFDVTPADLIAGIITEKGVISPVTREQIESVLQIA